MPATRNDTIRNPGEWAAERLTGASRWLGAVNRAVRGAPGVVTPAARTVTLTGLRDALSGGFDDFMACRSDVLFLCVVYPLAGLVAVGLATDAALAPLLFPAVSGLALVGPAVAVVLYEMSRRRERGEAADWSAVLGVLGSPSFGAMTLLAVALFAVFGLWLAVAQGLYMAFLGPQPPDSIAAFLSAALFTAPGWAMAVTGVATGFLFACLALSVSVVSFPLMLDRQVGVIRAVRASIDVVAKNPVAMAAWGLVVAGGLLLGSLPLFLGLVVAMPVLGHATWRLYRVALT